MRLTRRKIWEGVLLLLSAVVLLALFYAQKNARFSVGSEQVVTSPRREGKQSSYRYPEFESKGVLVSENITAPLGLTLKAALTFVQNELPSLFAIRSHSSLYPDGTSEQYEVLYAAEGKVFRILVAKEGIVSRVAVPGEPVLATPFPVSIPDSSDALLQLTANPYFRNAEVLGVALYFDEREKRWSYMVRTSMGDVSVLIQSGGGEIRNSRSK